MPKFNGYKRLLLPALLFISLQAITYGVKAQSAGDIQRVRQKVFYTGEHYYSRPGNDKTLLRTNSKNKLAAWNPVSVTLKGLMFFYQHVITQQLSASCPYEITCSNFSKTAINEFGVLKGVLMSADRLMRCNRIALTEISPLNINEDTGSIIDDLNNYR
jgi:putative component of membrane protein insertase Oxa1/YidC/SpoIIIJ protein YidD